MDEKDLVGKLFASLPVLRDSLPPDISRLVEMLRKAFLSRGLSRPSRSQILAAIEALSKFEVGLITTEELASCSEPKEIHASVSTVAEVIGLARQLSTLSERAAEAASPTGQSPALSSPKALRAPSLSIISPGPLAPEWTSLEGSDHPTPVPRTPPPSPSSGDPQSPAWTTKESKSSKVVVTPDSAFFSCSNSQFEVLKTPLETDASFRPVTPDSSPFREADQERSDHQEPAPRIPSPDEPWSSWDSSDLPVAPDSSCTSSSEAEVPGVPSDFIRPLTPPFNNGSDVCREPLPMTPPLSPEKPQSLACSPKRKDISEKAALPAAPDSSLSSSCSSCSDTVSNSKEIMIEMHVPGYKYGKLLGTGGSNIKRIQALTGAKLFLAREHGSLEIRGTKKQCLEAQILAQQLVNEVDHLQGILCHLPYNFFNQRSIWIDSRLEDIALQNSCKIEPLTGAYNRRNFVFICGSLKSDVECCCSAVEKWVKEFLQFRSPQVEPCHSRNHQVEPCSSSKSAATCAQKPRIRYNRDQLMSFCSEAELDLEFLPGTQQLGILLEARNSAGKGNATAIISWNHANLWRDDGCMPESAFPVSDQTWKKKSRDREDSVSKWEHDLFEG